MTHETETTDDAARIARLTSHNERLIFQVARLHSALDAARRETVQLRVELGLNPMHCEEPASDR
jgi:hypothetical protein